MIKKKNNKTCVCCQKKYTFCMNCSDFDNLPRWMATFHDANCKKIFNVIANYNYKKITREEAKAILDSCDLSNKDDFKENIKKVIDEIYASYSNFTKHIENEVEDKTDTVVNTVIDAIVKDEMVETEMFVETIEQVEEPMTYKKHSKKKERKNEEDINKE